MKNAKVISDIKKTVETKRQLLNKGGGVQKGKFDLWNYLKFIKSYKAINKLF